MEPLLPALIDKSFSALTASKRLLIDAALLLSVGSSALEAASSYSSFLSILALHFAIPLIEFFTSVSVHFAPDVMSLSSVATNGFNFTTSDAHFAFCVSLV